MNDVNISDLPWEEAATLAGCDPEAIKVARQLFDYCLEGATGTGQFWKLNHNLFEVHVCWVRDGQHSEQVIEVGAPDVAAASRMMDALRREESK